MKIIKVFLLWWLYWNEFGLIVCEIVLNLNKIRNNEINLKYFKYIIINYDFKSMLFEI